MLRLGGPTKTWPKKSPWFEVGVGGGRDGVLVEVETGAEGLLGQTHPRWFPAHGPCFPKHVPALLRVCKRTLDREVDTDRAPCVCRLVRILRREQLLSCLEHVAFVNGNSQELVSTFRSLDIGLPHAAWWLRADVFRRLQRTHMTLHVNFDRIFVPHDLCIRP